MRRLIKPLTIAVPAAFALAMAPTPPPTPAHVEPAHGAPAAKPVAPAKRTDGAAPKAAVPREEPAKEPVAAPAARESASEEVTADRALTLMREGNERWCDGKPTAPHTDEARLKNLAEKGQKPFATVITCSDSRIPVERVFDQGVGDLFVVRVAGNRAGDSESGTVEYGLEHLKTPVLVVMGHTKCGAVAAAVSGAKLHGKVGELVRGIQPAVERAKRNNPGADEKTLAALAVRENVWQTIFDLYKSSDAVREMVQHGEVRVVGAVYDIADGKVEWLGEHPWQEELLSAMKPAKSETAEAAVPEK